MSIILDALRRGRGRQAPRANPNTAQTDAVLHTLGYGRFSPASPLNRLKRIAGYLAAGFALAILLWGTIIWMTQGYLTPDSTRVSSAVPDPISPPPSVAPTPVVEIAPTASTGATAPPPTSVDKPVADKLVVDKPVADKPLNNPVARPAAKPAPAPAAPAPAVNIAPAVAKPLPAVANPAPAPAPAQATPTAPSVPRLGPIVEYSQRKAVPEAAPTPPSGAPSRTALSVSAGTNTATITTGDDHFGKAVYFQKIGDFENALFHYKALLQRDELNAEAHNNLGLLYRDKGLAEDAVKEFQRAIAIEPRYPRARNNLGVVYLSQRKLDAAASEFHAALAVDARNVESLVNLSTVEKEAGRRDDARSALVRALEIDPRNAEAHYNFALLEEESGNKEQALAYYRAFLQHGAAGHPSLVGEVRKRVAVLSR